MWYLSQHEWKSVWLSLKLILRNIWHLKENEEDEIDCQEKHFVNKSFGPGSSREHLRTQGLKRRQSLLPTTFFCTPKMFSSKLGILPELASALRTGGGERNKGARQWCCSPRVTRNLGHCLDLAIWVHFPWLLNMTTWLESNQIA